MREAAQEWWATKITNGTAAGLTTWALFAADVRQEFLPLDVVRWAMRERESLVGTKNRNVLDYTAKFNEIDQLLLDEAPLARVLAYERGLPVDYAVKCAELTAMMAERFQVSGRERGRGGRQGGRSSQRQVEGVPRARSRTPGLSDELVRSRIRAGQCIRCGQEGHYKAECTNEAKLN